MKKINFKGEITIIKRHAGKIVEKHHQSNLIVEGLQAWCAGKAIGGGGSSWVTEGILGECITLGKGSVVPESTDRSVTTACSFTSASSDKTTTFADGVQKTFGFVGYSSSDTSLSIVRKDVQVFVEDEHSIKYRYKFIVPADSRYVDTITEICLYADAINTNSGEIGICVTHALLKDAEGNPYSIEKTALDELDIYYDITMSSNSDNFKLAKRAYNAGYVDRFLWNADTDIDKNKVFDSFKLCDAKLYKNVMYFSYGGSAKQNSYVPQYNANNHLTSGYIASLPSIRVLRNKYSIKRYIMRFMMLAQQCLEVSYPNNLFGTHEITDIAIGAGDGATTDFKCPISFFIKNTETLYKDGVALTRNVDYTIDNFNNADELPELYPSTHLLPISHGDDSTSGAYYENLIVADKVLANKVNTYHYQLFPYYLEQGTKTIKKANIKMEEWLTLYMPVDQSAFDWNVDTAYVSYYNNTVTIDLEYSTDGETFTNILEGVSCYNGHNSNNPQGVAKETGWVKYNFEAVKAPYWRIRAHSTSSGRHYDIGLLLCREASKYIHFNTAPGANTELKMKASVDRPYMDGNHVVDVGATIQF